MFLKDKVVLVTGAGRGIGAAAALAAGSVGATVIVTARRLEDAKARAGAITGAGGKAEGFACDVAGHEDVAALVEKVSERLGGIDVLVNNAGVVEPIGPVADVDPNDFAKTITINLVGAWHMVRAVLPLMRGRGGGTIVNLSSGAAHQPFEGWAAYCASKAGLAMLTRSIDLEHRADGIVSIGFAPGVVDTDMQGQVRASGINRVSKLAREQLAPADLPGRMIAWLSGPDGRDYAGQEIDARNEELAARFDAAWSKG